jgi:hypothetical protein
LVKLPVFRTPVKVSWKYSSVPYVSYSDSGSLLFYKRIEEFS